MEFCKTSSEKHFDPFRKKWVKSRPEEIVRLSLLHKMVHELSYPQAYIAIEKNLRSLPHLSPAESQLLPPRRLDIVVFGKDLHPQYPLFPLLIVECKVDGLTLENSNQLIGYNEIIKSPYLALANGFQVKTGCYDHEKKGYHFVDGLFSYCELIKHLAGANQ